MANVTVWSNKLHVKICYFDIFNIPRFKNIYFIISIMKFNCYLNFEVLFLHFNLRLHLFYNALQIINFILLFDYFFIFLY